MLSFPLVVVLDAAVERLSDLDIIPNVLLGDFDAGFDAGFYLEKMETYALFFEEKDYQYFVFRAKKPVQQSTEKSKWQVLKERIIIRLKYGISS